MELFYLEYKDGKTDGEIRTLKVSREEFERDYQEIRCEGVKAYNDKEMYIGDGSYVGQTYYTGRELLSDAEQDNLSEVEA